MAAFVLPEDEEPASGAALIDVLEEASPAVLVDEGGGCPDYFLQVLRLTSLSLSMDKMHLVWMNTRNTSCCPFSL